MPIKVKQEVRRGFDFVPGYIEDFLRSGGKEQIVAAVNSDMQRDGRYGETWLLAYSDRLMVLGGSCHNGEWVERETAEYQYNEVKEFRIEQYVASGALVAEFDSGDFELCEFSNTYAKKLGHLANLLNKMKAGKEITDEDFHYHEEDEFCPNCGTRYRDAQRRICPKCMNRKALFMRVLGYAPKYKLELFLIFVTILGSSALSLVRPQLNNRFLFDEVLSASSPYYGKILYLVLAILLLESVSLLVSVVNGRMGAKLAAHIIYDIKLELFSAMQKLSLSFYNRKQTGHLMTRVNNDALDIQYFLNDGIPHFVINLISIVGILVIMFSYSPILAISVFIPVPFIICIIRKVIPRFKKYKWRVWTKNSRMNSLLNDSLTGMRVVKAFGKEQTEVERFSDINGQLYDANIVSGKINSQTFPLLGYLMTIGGLFVWGIGGWNVVNGNMSFGILMTFVSYVTMIYGPLDFMVRIFDWWTNCMNSAQRIFEIIDTVPEVTESPHPVAMDRIEGKIDIKDITFEYEPNKPVLHEINLTIKEGEMIGLVGHSGAGKSTITNLITRLYDVNEGSIEIDGVNIKEIALDDLRSQIGMVLQDTFLFSGTIAENIAYARPEAGRDEIVAAAKLANAHDFIMKMADGYETVIGRRRNSLSGGEKQRISIARAILVNPRILILDEATASVDTETERMIQEALERLVRGRTTIAIAHRLSTLRNADRIVVVDHGTIAEVGTHEELEQKHGFYYDMLQMQKEALKIRGVE